jgi:predicted transcriptional regulator
VHEEQSKAKIQEHDLNGPAPLAKLAAELVAVYVSKNTVTIGELPPLIENVNASLISSSNHLVGTDEGTLRKCTPEQIRQSIRPDGLVSFVDGKIYKMLKRHLSRYGISIAEYKEIYGLPKDYPTTSTEYSARRSKIAKNFKFGRRVNSAESPSQTEVKAPGRR